MGSAKRWVQELHLDDIEAATAGFSGMELELSLLSPPARPWRFVESRLDDVGFIAGEMGAALAASGRVCSSNHWFFFPTTPPPRWTVNGLRVKEDALHLMPAGGEFLVGASQPVEWLGVQVAPDEFNERRTALGGTGASRFSAFLGFRTGRAQLASLHRAIGAGLALVRKEPAIIHNESACRRLQGMVLGRLVECTLDDAAQPPPRGAALTARLLRHLEERDGEAVFTEDLCAALGVSERSLRRLFMGAFATSPARFLRQRRLQLAHRALLAPAPGKGVTDVCYTYGFFDPGRFAADYRALFGELPSATLQKAAGSAATAR